MRIPEPAFLLLFSFVLASCSPGEDCFVSDVVDRVTSFDVDGNFYVLYLRVLGFSEEEHFYEFSKSDDPRSVDFRNC